MSEFSLIATYFTRPPRDPLRTPLSIGDDAALLAPATGFELAITTDMLVEGTHFLPGDDPEWLGWKVIAVNLSDLAAMGATPRWLLLAGALPVADGNWLAAFSRGAHACAERYGADLVGGDTTRGPRNFCVTAIGEVPVGQSLRRDGGHPGDDLWVSGRPGRAALGLAHRLGQRMLPEAARQTCCRALDQPQPRIELGHALRSLAHAAIDISDGLIADLGHILDRSGLAADVFADRLPLPYAGAERTDTRTAVLAGGDDYELLFAAPPTARVAIDRLGATLDLPLTRFGTLRSGPAGACRILDSAGASIPLSRHGFDHFSTP